MVFGFLAVLLFTVNSYASDYIPSIENGKILYQTNCVSCHGSRGDADTVIAGTLKKPPRSFADPKVQESLTPQAAFEAMSEGRLESGMPPFQNLSIEERWDIAAYLFTLRTDFMEVDEPRPELMWGDSLKLSDLEITDMFRRRGVPEDTIPKELSIIRLFPQ